MTRLVMVRNDTRPHQMVAFAMKLLAHPLRILISLRVREGPRLCSSARQKQKKKTKPKLRRSQIWKSVFLESKCATLTLQLTHLQQKSMYVWVCRWPNLERQMEVSKIFRIWEGVCKVEAKRGRWSDGLSVCHIQADGFRWVRSV